MPQRHALCYCSLSNACCPLPWPGALQSHSPAPRFQLPLHKIHNTDNGQSQPGWQRNNNHEASTLRDINSVAAVFPVLNCQARYRCIHIGCQSGKACMISRARQLTEGCAKKDVVTPKLNAGVRVQLMVFRQAKERGSSLYASLCRLGHPPWNALGPTQCAEANQDSACLTEQRQSLQDANTTWHQICLDLPGDRSEVATCHDATRYSDPLERSDLASCANLAREHVVQLLWK